MAKKKPNPELERRLRIYRSYVGRIGLVYMQTHAGTGYKTHVRCKCLDVTHRAGRVYLVIEPVQGYGRLEILPDKFDDDIER